MRMANICMAIALMMVFVMPSQSIMQFAYECIGDNATATTYSYSKEPRLVETGYTKGLKSGSFNYLENGSINLREEMIFDYGNGTDISNSSIDHSLNVEFDGDRGISEFFARGLYGNNRWISAWKKIRYEESPNIQVDKRAWKSRPSNSIVVDASVYMDTKSENVTYGFDYEADIENGTIETKDATGWTNRTGSMKYDWEQETRVAGDKLNITNQLYESVEKVAAGGPGGDWLPCCMSGTRPMIDQLDWPSDVMIATLEANRLRPTRSLSTAYTSGDSPVYRKREIQIGLSSRPLVPVQNAEVSVISLSNVGWSTRGGLATLKANTLLPTMHLSTAYPAPSSDYPVYWKREAQIGLRSLLPSAVVPLKMTVNSSTSVPMQDKANSSLFSSVPVQNPANCIGDNCPANFFVSKNQSDLNCNEGACDGFDCIYTYDEDSVGASVAGRSVPLRRGETRNIRVSAKVIEKNHSTKKAFYGGEPEDAQEERYRIDVTNNGDVLLSNVSATAEMAKGMMYENSVLFYDPATGNLLPNRVPLVFSEDVKTEVTWIFGTMQPNETRTILMRTYQKVRTYQKKDMNIDNRDISVKVVGIAPDNTLVKDSVNRAEMEGCEFRSDSGGPCSPDEIEWEICTKKVCPNWINASI